jgi:hypothetical protein
MADNQGDMRAHRDTYEGVIGLLKWGTVGCAIVAALVVLWIGR